MCRVLPSRPLLLALIALAVFPLGAVQAACPRSRGEQTRRLVPSVLLLPAAPFILTHQPRSAPLPPPGAAVRVSHRDAAGRMQFLRGSLAGIATAAGWAVFHDDPKLGPLAAFGVGSVVYGVLGGVTGTVVGAALRGTSWDTVLDRTR
jgi:hypothetical protein